MASEAELLRRIAELEDELRVQRERAETTVRILDLVMRQIPGTYWMVDRDLCIIRTGGAIEQVLGYPADRFIGMTMQEAITQDPSTGDAIAAHRRALAGELVQSENEYRGKLLAMAIGPFRDASGAIVAALGTSVDVTAWRQFERRVVDAQRAESLGLLAGGLAHDFNNLLVAVLGNADLALREIRTGMPGRTEIENIRTAGLRAAELTEQLLAYAGRGGAGTTRIEPAGIVEELVRITAPSVPRNVQISVDIPTRLAVRGDPTQLRQVLLNLIANARDALTGRGGTIRVQGRLEQSSGELHPQDMLTPPAGAYVVIEVADDGPGMDAETQRHVFEPFYTTKQTGHGLGLAAVLGIVRSHGGGIRLISAPGAGATFEVFWPAAATAPMRAVSQPPIAGRTVLVIDDETMVRDVVTRMVEDLGYSALAAGDGPSGLALLDLQPVDAVLVDLTMPGMSGADVVAAVRARQPGLPIIVCSGFDRDGRGPAGADAYLAKPFRIDTLERTLLKLLPLRSV